MLAKSVHQQMHGGRDLYVATLGVAALLIFVALSIFLPDRFPNPDNLSSMALQLAELGILSVAMTLSLLIGGIDLSIMAVANLAAILAGLIIKSIAPPEAGDSQIVLAMLVGTLTAIATGWVVGKANGLLITRIGIPSILATLGTWTLVSGLAFGITNGSAVSRIPDPLVAIGTGSLAGMPIPFLVFILVWIGAAALVSKTAFGASMMLVGTSIKVARFSGIPTNMVIERTHVISGLLAALTGLISLLRTNSAHADYGETYILLSILVAVLGGVSVTGGFGKLLGVLWALLILQFLSTGFSMILLGVSGGNFFREFIWGLLLLFVMALSTILRARKLRAPR